MQDLRRASRGEVSEAIAIATAKVPDGTLQASGPEVPLATLLKRDLVKDRDEPIDSSQRPKPRTIFQ